MKSNYERILIEEIGLTKKIILNRPEKRNSLDEIMIKELNDAVTKISNDSETKSVILTGAGGHFCTGSFFRLCSEDITI